MSEHCLGFIVKSNRKENNDGFAYLNCMTCFYIQCCRKTFGFFSYLFEGAAGLYCGILLAEAGHTVTIFEATDRAGGRIQTYRDPKDPSKYIANLGPFRFPLGVQPYMNYLLRERYKLNITEFPTVNINVDTYMNGVFSTNKQANQTSNVFQYNTSQNEREKVRKCFYIHM